MTNTKILQAQLEASLFMSGQSEGLMMPVTVLSSFLGAALYGVHNARYSKDVMSLEELGDIVGIPPTSMSTHLRYLSHKYREGKEGMGLVFLAPHPENGRKKTFGLTQSGMAAVQHLEGIYLNALR
ncbi:hypothetical protein [Agrobacterium rosae]|uniref:hypothetical protein n=1 Tax=Agrobacterium rosae TaxID=1972867 RepID=UPI000CD959AE|nr:hypothetical protein [Agrobacterium rosae]POO56171.1 hypothetical protein CTT39_05340 [Agrobacterium rosae]